MKRAFSGIQAAALLFLGAMICNPSLKAQVVYNDFGSTYFQNFNSLANTEDSLNSFVNNSTLAGWYLEGTTPDYLADQGDDASNGFRSFGSSGSGDRALGAAGSSSSLNQWGVRIQNATAFTLTDFTLTYTGEQWMQQAFAKTYTLGYSIQDSGMESITTGSYTTILSLSFTTRHNGSDTAVDGNHPDNQVLVSGTLNGLNWAPNQDLWLRWTMSTTSDADAAGIDDLSFSAIPEPSTAGLLLAGLGTLGMLRRFRF
jgi:hypothetical protein